MNERTGQGLKTEENPEIFQGSRDHLLAKEREQFQSPLQRLTTPFRSTPLGVQRGPGGHAAETEQTVVLHSASDAIL